MGNLQSEENLTHRELESLEDEPTLGKPCPPRVHQVPCQEGAQGVGGRQEELGGGCQLLCTKQDKWVALSPGSSKER